MITLKFEELENILNESLSNYKLCYVDLVPEIIEDWDEDSKAYLSRPEFNLEKEENHAYRNPHLRKVECPNPEYDRKTSKYIAYFTTKDLKDQWGVDWEDSPYEYNSGKPYDSEDYEILSVTFGFNNSTAWIKLPLDYTNCGNSFWSVQDINSGAVAWIFASGVFSNVSIQAGCNLEDFINKVNIISKL